MNRNDTLLHRRFEDLWNRGRDDAKQIGMKLT